MNLKRPYHKRGELIDGYMVGQHPLYSIWAGMKDRCYNKNNKHYKNYGGRGIVVCDEWLHSFKQFAFDMGIPPKDGNRYTIERVNNSMGYNPKNCAWKTYKEQARNKRVYKTSSTGLSGIRITKSGSYQVRQKFTRELLGCFKTLEEAIEAQKTNYKNNEPRISNTTGYTGISRHIDGGFIIRKTINHKRVYLGYKKTLEEAIELYANS